MMSSTLIKTLVMMLLVVGSLGIVNEASGSFDTQLDFSTLTFTPIGSNRCRIEVEGTLMFTGTLVGEAKAKTSALAMASCEEVQANPPGDIPDTFQSKLIFEGEIDGTDIITDIIWNGSTEAGGSIEKSGMTFPGSGVAGQLKVIAQVGFGGEYEGKLKLN
uniref:Lipid/polyisoprenoid-binding YceI-like domain-containing protein n=1 Tax=Amphora coffeiformis TaxID=265554 RepID=A0A7S3L9X6_9STRA|eukprot:scaffold1129_cov164-Amphora_coffeaeformis.AAC.6